jgi:hypothetical protein
VVFTGVPVGDYTITATKTGYKSKSINVTVTPGIDDPHVITLS